MRPDAAPPKPDTERTKESWDPEPEPAVPGTGLPLQRVCGRGRGFDLFSEKENLSSFLYILLFTNTYSFLKSAGGSEKKSKINVFPTGLPVSINAYKSS